MAKTTRTPEQSPLQHARTVLGQSPRDVSTYLNIGEEALDWLTSIFSAIEMYHESGGGEVHIKRLAGVGRFVASDISDLLGCANEKIVSSIEAAEREAQS